MHDTVIVRNAAGLFMFKWFILWVVNFTLNLKKKSGWRGGEGGDREETIAELGTQNRTRSSGGRETREVDPPSTHSWGQKFSWPFQWFSLAQVWSIPGFGPSVKHPCSKAVGEDDCALFRCSMKSRWSDHKTQSAVVGTPHLSPEHVSHPSPQHFLWGSQV